VAKLLMMTIQVNLVPIPSEAGMRQQSRSANFLLSKINGLGLTAFL